jgi:hypothetical protein
MLRVRTGKAPHVLRITVAALLLFSCARVIRPLASWTASASPGLAVRCLQVTRNTVLEVGGGSAKLVRPLAVRFRDALLSLVATLSVLQLSLRPRFVRVWPEHRQSFFRRILPFASDSGH